MKLLAQDGHYARLHGHRGRGRGRLVEQLGFEHNDYMFKPLQFGQFGLFVLAQQTRVIKGK